jgi:hypothetical protein
MCRDCEAARGSSFGTSVVHWTSPAIDIPEKSHVGVGKNEENEWEY